MCKPRCWTPLAFGLAGCSGWALGALRSFGSIPGPARPGPSAHGPPPPAVRTSAVSRLCLARGARLPYRPTVVRGHWPPPCSLHPPSTCRLSAPPLPSDPSTPAPRGRSGGVPALPQEEGSPAGGGGRGGAPSTSHPIVFLLIRAEA